MEQLGGTSTTISVFVSLKSFQEIRKFKTNQNNPPPPFPPTGSKPSTLESIVDSITPMVLNLFRKYWNMLWRHV